MTTPVLYLRFKSPFFTLLKFALLIPLYSCSQYELTLNEKTVYDPTEFRRSLSLDDPALEACIKSALAENAIARASQLRNLQCGPGQIQSLAGLEIFSNLTHLGLSTNQIRSIEPLESLNKLQQLDISNNNIGNTEVLHTLEQLRYLNLEGNNALECSTVSWAEDRKTLELLIPAHC